MVWDLEASLKKAKIEKEWIFGDRYFRIGDPFQWVDGDLQISKSDFRGSVDLMQWISGYYEKYETLKEFKYKNYDSDYNKILKVYNSIFDSYFVFLSIKEKKYRKKNLVCHALARIQDYCVLKKYTKNLNPGKIEHLDFGPGLGGNAVYSLKLLGANYTAVEAHYWSYEIQRMFFSKLITPNEKYLDLTAAETFGKQKKDLISLSNSKNFEIKQIPSWHFDYIKKDSKDLITATTCLNELNTAGIIYFLFNANRVLKKNGYLYIRDSAKLKPNRHEVNYDKVLTDYFGFKLIKDFRHLKNRKDIFALPRLYKKVKNKNSNFDELFNSIVGRFAVTSHGANNSQNMSKKNIIIK